MPLPPIDSVVELVNAGLEGRQALREAKRTGRVRPAALALSGFMLLLVLGGFLNSTILLAASVLPTTAVCWWGAWRAWGTADDRRPLLATALVGIGAAFALYAVAVGTPGTLLATRGSQWLFWLSLGVLLVGLLLALAAWWREEWSEI